MLVAEATGASVTEVEEKHTKWELDLWVAFLSWKNTPKKGRPPRGPSQPPPWELGKTP
jgi:hypothetical protein